jgi:hypothetical protein
VPNFLFSCFYFLLPLFYDSHRLYLKTGSKRYSIWSCGGSDILVILFVKSYSCFLALKQGWYSFFAAYVSFIFLAMVYAKTGTYKAIFLAT